MTLFTQEKADPLLLLDRFLRHCPGGGCRLYPKEEHREPMDYAVLKKNFENHRFHTSYFETKEEAAAYLSNQIKGEKVGFGGSITAKVMNLFEVLGKDNEVIWHWEQGPEARIRAKKESTVYILSANAAAETGQIINIDGTGNRLSESLFGPKRVYYVIGKNKIAPDLSSAMDRARNIACPKNAARFNKKTPCVVSDDQKCYDCNSPERICNAILILERPCTGMEVEMVFINEDLGY